MENINQLKAFLQVPRYIVITTHRNPDGDAIGSSLGLYHFLNKFGHTVRIISPSDYPENFSWMKDVERIIIFDSDGDAAKEVLELADLIFCLDFNDLERIDKLGELIKPLPTPVSMIDHHLYPEPFAEYTLSDPTASSTSELIYDFIHLLGWEKEMDHTIGTCLYTGIITDTGSFKYSTSPKLFQVVSKLIELGVDDYDVQDKIYNSLSEKQLRLLGHCLANRMEILDEFRTGIIVLTKDDYETFDIQRGDTEGIVNYLLMMKKIKMAAFITEQPTIVKISLRSKGDFSVQEIAKEHFNGGGHKNAAGGYSFKNLNWIVRHFKKVLPDYKSKLWDIE
ncbi:MAG TPA: bifunctional oligoribonuclease/PAP phosphatase NrnA [Saprospiraceae bacterium]|nr:bifunctional oligoribonuclease/PAP phosphatase NrnA [Saprospiraceae bacterium]